MDSFETDYLIVGAGASGFAFADALLGKGCAYHAGGSVGQAGRPLERCLPFLRLHQPSSYYGVSSLNLGCGSIDQFGLNKGFEELASDQEVATYFPAVMRDRLLKSGRVRFLPMSEHLGHGEVQQLLSNEITQIDVRHRLVDTTFSENGIPLTHKRKFHVAADVDCIPPELPTSKAAFS